MSVREKFKNQWHDIQNVVLSEAYRQIQINGKINTESLTEKLEEETSKWQRGILARGVLYAEIARASPSKAIIFSESAERLEFTEPQNNKRPSTWWITFLCILLSIGIGVAAHLFTHADLIEKIFYPTLCFVITNALCSPIKNMLRNNATDRIIDDISRQMEDMKEFLEHTL